MLVFSRQIEESLFVRISNTHGQVVHSQPVLLGSTELKLSLGNHPPGVYLISIRTSSGENYFSSSIVKQ